MVTPDTIGWMAIAAAAGGVVSAYLLQRRNRRRAQVQQVRERLRPSALQVALHSAPPSTPGSEANYFGYERQRIPSLDALSTIQFPEAAGGGCTVTHFAIYDHRGSIVLEGPLVTPIAVSGGVIPRLRVQP